TKEPDLTRWKDVMRKIKEPEDRVKVALVGKYVGFKDSYKSLMEALTHGGIANNLGVDIQWVDSEEVEKSGAEKFLSDVDSVLIPGGFGERGIEGKIETIQFAREKKIPFLGICLGMQCAVIEFARNVCGLKGANSTEFDLNTPYPVIYLIEEWYDFKTQTIQRRDITSAKGGTMRLGAYPCVLTENSFAYKAYGAKEISERHRHRYEFNNFFKDILVKNGLKISGISPDGELVEIVEIENHPWFFGCQFHPEFKSRPLDPHPVFSAFIAAAYREKELLFTRQSVQIPVEK
ncbi:MAG: CTP synthase, partial [Nitrospirota bacterium]